MKLLCGTDFSPNSNDALAAAASLAKRMGDSLELVHALASPVDDGTSPAAPASSESVLRKRLESLAAPLRSAGLTVRTRLEAGSPVDVLDSLARALHPRWIVLSSIGRVALVRIVLGSTADRVAESAPAPTLVVRRGLVFTEWQQKERPLRLFVAADASAASDHALALARDWASSGPVALRIGHVIQSSRGSKQPPSVGGAVPKNPQGPKALERKLRERIATILGETPYGLEMIPPTESASDALIAAAKAHRAGVLFTGTTQTRGIRRLWHRSVSRALLADAPMNVAVVPAPLADDGNVP